ncbi:hypothetical protein [Synechococcus elongatus]|uniref:Glycerophosphoryl diester phosphodiesterase membrane domain-containing protein n=2 Tax=Synechococcus elongatus TaxID=32046 RepID=Q31RA4_SYNE7|nr:hypothetical protein [Synechococcus elongatus]ABB56415.1 hypothetical protein Synpcc7942_0383 [Synechococcus elongatus PCC 7942 = FACHB-805]AJD56538.1 hypothetical protein M744_01065 [Synechococcus elongatus UTEX 2973]MBD2588252.1 hypothetical protein [Synechococcus elongatus FACHB-242]MBD2689320.1 hypothetical protein [Synechococcus elongatus FACHB-1061]MBD2707040.1 hypothetical protein [Synechococcus elongatus PCC 7942 = FACHB-805]
MASSSFNSNEDLLNRDYEFRFGSYLSRGWAIFKQNLGLFIAYLIIVGLISIALSSLDAAFVADEEGTGLRFGPGGAIQLVINGPLSAGFFLVAFKTIKQQRVEFGDFFRGFNRFLPFFLTSLLTSALTLIGFVLLIVPGIYLAIAYVFALPLVAERNLEPWAALELSRRLITKKWLTFFGFLIVLGLINFAGALPCGIGLLFTIPWSICAITAAYEDIVGIANSSEDA